MFNFIKKLFNNPNDEILITTFSIMNISSGEIDYYIKYLNYVGFKNITYVFTHENGVTVCKLYTYKKDYNNKIIKWFSIPEELLIYNIKSLYKSGGYLDNG